MKVFATALPAFCSGSRDYSNGNPALLLDVSLPRYTGLIIVALVFRLPPEGRNCLHVAVGGFTAWVVPPKNQKVPSFLVEFVFDDSYYHSPLLSVAAR
jgi:hypothetical protein